MTDQEIIQKLIDQDEKVTREFFFIHCKPLFLSIIKKVFDYPVDYDEFVNELYVHLMEDGARRLKTYKFDSSLYGWLKMVAIHYFMDKKNHDKVIEKERKDPPYGSKGELTTPEPLTEARMDVERLLTAMPNKRYAEVLQKLLIEDMPHEALAKEMGITTANLYNIKKRAIQQLTLVAIKDIENYKKIG